MFELTEISQMRKLLLWGAAFTYLLFSFGCKSPVSTEKKSTMTHQEVIQAFDTNYVQLPEKMISISADSSVYAQYAQPTEKYSHGVLGDAIEAEMLVVYENGDILTLELDSQYVFEDLSPRLVDIDGDGRLEILTIRSHAELGAGIAIYKADNGALMEYAHVEEIGRKNRWLNIAAAMDLDNDGTCELAWVETPHAGCILKVARIAEGNIVPIDTAAQYSNHALGERNLALSVVAQNDNQTILYVPTKDRESIDGFVFAENKLSKVDSFAFSVDFSQSLESQYSFSNVRFSAFKRKN